MRESVVERYLHQQVRKAGGDTRKFTGRIHVPDRLVIWPFGDASDVQPDATLHLIEAKAPGKKPRAGQVREHNRLRKLGVKVFVIDTKLKVDEYVAVNK